jgi:hypothetical protein
MAAITASSTTSPSKGVSVGTMALIVVITVLGAIVAKDFIFWTLDARSIIVTERVNCGDEFSIDLIKPIASPGGYEVEGGVRCNLIARKSEAWRFGERSFDIEATCAKAIMVGQEVRIDVGKNGLFGKVGGCFVRPDGQIVVGINLAPPS